MVLAIALAENYSDPDDPLVLSLSADKLQVYSKRINIAQDLTEEDSESDNKNKDVTDVVVSGLLRVKAQNTNVGSELRIAVVRVRTYNIEVYHYYSMLKRKILF